MSCLGGELRRHIITYLFSILQALKWQSHSAGRYFWNHFVQCTYFTEEEMEGRGGRGPPVPRAWGLARLSHPDYPLQERQPPPTFPLNSLDYGINSSFHTPPALLTAFSHSSQPCFLLFLVPVPPHRHREPRLQK